VSKVVVTCALTGAADTVKKNLAVPVTPEQIANAAIDAAKAGAAVVHIHVRDPETGKPSMELDLYREVVERIRASDTDVVINLTTGPGQRWRPGDDDPKIGGPESTLVTPEERVRHVQALRPELCSLDVATMNSGEVYNSTMMLNWPPHLRRMATLMREAGTKPELECFDIGHAVLANALIEEGVIDRPPFFQFALGILYGAPADQATLAHLLQILPADAQWAAFGIGRLEFPMVALSYLAGGHVRVGLEDNLYLERGVLATNAQLVEKAVSIIQLLGGNIATPEEARNILGVGQPALSGP
jgi:uncharacterized protein (DUF849 family)